MAVHNKIIYISSIPHEARLDCQSITEELFPQRSFFLKYRHNRTEREFISSYPPPPDLPYLVGETDPGGNRMVTLP